MWERISRRLFAISPIAISQASWLNSSHKERISFLLCGSESAFYSVGNEMDPSPLCHDEIAQHQTGIEERGSTYEQV